MVKNPPANAAEARDADSIREWGRSPEKEMATHFHILALAIPWTEEPGGLQSIESQSWTSPSTDTLHGPFLGLGD